MAFAMHSPARSTTFSQVRNHPWRLMSQTSVAAIARGPHPPRPHGHPDSFRNQPQGSWRVWATAADRPQEKRSRSPNRFADLAADEPSERIARPRTQADPVGIPPARSYRPDPASTAGTAYRSTIRSPAPVAVPPPTAETSRRVPRRVSGPVDETRLPYPIVPPSAPSSPAPWVPRSATPAEAEPSVEAVELSVKETSAVRQRLNKKLSEANAYVRHLKRQLDERDAKLVDGMSDLALVAQELKGLIEVVRMIAQEHAVGRPMPKIGDRYAHSVLGTRLEALLVRTELKILDVDSIRVRPVRLRWYGMAQDVRVMGSFDSWTRGEQMSIENTGAENEFSCTLMLRPGKYEIKFVVDGEWRVTDAFPMVGEGFEANNLLTVE